MGMKLPRRDLRTANRGTDALTLFNLRICGLAVKLIAEKQLD